MINKNELVQLLQKYGFTEEQINRIVKSKTLIKKGIIDKIEQNLEVLINNNIPLENISKCSIVLYLNNYLEIKEVFKVLDKHEISKEKIENCLYVLAQGKAQEIEEIFNVLEAHNISKGTIENCLSVLAQGKAQEIEEIFNVLEEHNISKGTIENCLSVLAKGKAQEIEEIFKILDEQEIPKHNIEENYGNIFRKDINDFTKIFSILPEDANNENIIMYMKLKGYYNRIVTKEELNQIGQFRNIDVETIINAFFKKEYIIHYKKTIDEKGGLYIGRSIPMNIKDMNRYGNIICDISKRISNVISYKYKYDKQELESYCTSILVEKCGDIVYNCSINQEMLYACLYKKAKKCCIGYVLEQKNNFKVDFSKFENTTKTAKYNQNSIEKEELDVEQWNLKSEDKKIIKTLSSYLEMGYDNKMAFENTARDLDLDIEELMYNIEEIKNQILENVKENEKLDEEERE